jgi:DNA-binding NarL/FixJ family response regulator
MSTTIHVAIIEDDKDIREGLTFLINASDGFLGDGIYGDVETALRDMSEHSPDVCLLDIDLPGMNGIEGIPLLKKKNDEMDIIMMTIHEDHELVFEALRAGACGYLTKNVQPSKILESIREVYEGGAPMSSRIARMVVSSMHTSSEGNLTKREKEVLNHLCDGESYKIIAENLFISEQTVHFHIKNIYQKLQVHSKSEAVSKALRERLV